MEARVRRGTIADRAAPMDATPLTNAERQQLLAAMLVESSDDAIIGTNKDSVITTWNRAAQRLYGHAALDVIGKNIAFLLPPDRPDEVQDIQDRVATGEGPLHYETSRVHKD